MFVSQRSNLVKYVPAELHENKEWYISYYVLNPETNKLKRKVIRLNRMKSITARRKWAKELVRDLNIKLSTGWNPYFEQEASRGFNKLFDVINTFLESKQKELRPDSIRSYKSFIKILMDYVAVKCKNKDMYVISFDKNYAIRFMQDLYLHSKISERTYNNQVAFYKLFFNWCIQYNYSNVNPFEGIAKKKEKQKKREMIDPEFKTKIKEYLEKHNPEYFVICMLAHYALLRPKEITYLKIKDIDLENQKIFISGKIAKNGNDRRPTIPDVLINYLKTIKINSFDRDLYLFSEKFKPGKTKIDPRVIAKYWDKLRKEIGMPMEMQFYSLRDTGITQMFSDHIDPVHIRNQADHSSLEITNVYTKFASNNISMEIKEKCKEF